MSSKTRGAGKKTLFKDKPVLSVEVAFNNIPGRSGFASAWGNSFLIKGAAGFSIFDTGCDGPMLLRNLKKLGVSPLEIKTVILSHDHWDHTGGLWALLEKNNKAEIFVPDRFSEKFKRRVRAAGAKVKCVRGPRKLAEGIYSSGQMSGRKWEQAVIAVTRNGPAVLTGCAHPGIVRVAKRCAFLHGVPYLVAGGFHLKDSLRDEIKSAVKELRAMGIKKAAPNHCTGAAAIKVFRSVWGKDFVNAPCGSSLLSSNRGRRA